MKNLKENILIALVCVSAIFTVLNFCLLAKGASDYGHEVGVRMKTVATGQPQYADGSNH